jgi:hypothetical protein
VLVEQMQGTLVTIAKDVKLQLEFNPATVAAYRLIGYENRRLADRDFNDDTKDAGDIGAGHSVTALYEIVPVGVDSPLGLPGVDPLKYQAKGTGDREQGTGDLADAATGGELLTLKLRYQPPSGGTSTLLTFPLKDSGAGFSAASADLQFAAAVASFGMLLRNSKFKGDANYASVLETAAGACGEDRRRLRAEFLELVKAAQRLAGEPVGTLPAWPTRRQTAIATSGQAPFALVATPWRNWSHNLPVRLVFVVGVLAGVGAALAALLVGLALGWWQCRSVRWPEEIGLKSKPVGGPFPSWR